MRTLRTFALTALLLAVTAAAWADDWTTDYKKALATAKADGKYVLVDFTGSDWCIWCQRLDGEVFSKKAFKDYAKDNLVLVKLDFPRRAKIDADIKKRNIGLAKEFGVRGFPTVLLLAPNGEEAARTGYQKGGAENYVQHLKKLIADHKDQLEKKTEK